MPIVVARTVAADYRRQQAGLKTLMRDHTRDVWTTLDPTRLGATLDPYIAAATSVTTGYGAAWAELAARFYEARRAAARIRGRYVPILAPPVPAEQVRATIRWATRDLWDDPGNAEAAGVADSALELIARSQGRDTLTENVGRDRQATAWAREAEPDACDWCLMLADRGAVYGSAESAGDGDQWHRDCACEVVPVFSGETYAGPGADGSD